MTGFVNFSKRTIRFIIVSAVSAICIHNVVTRAGEDISLPTAAIVVSHAYWISDTIVFNTLINVYAFIVYSIGTKRLVK